MEIIKLLPALPVLLLAGCNLASEHRAAGELRHETRSVELGKVEMVRAEVKMAAGELRLTGGSPRLLDADFEYSVPSFKPALRYDASGFRGRLTLEQPTAHPVSFGDCRNNWTLKLNEETPTDLVVHVGAGKGILRVGRLALRSLEVHMGAGEIDLDLTGGQFRRNLDVQVHGGVGQGLIRVPKNVGVMAEIHGGLGSIDASGLEKRGSKFVNSAYQTSEVLVSLKVHGGIGSIRLIGE